MNVRILGKLATVSLASFLTFASTAHADGKTNACADAYAAAQTLRDAHKLLEAREKLLVCSQTTCKPYVVKDCTAWLTETESTLPSVVFAARDSQGAPLSQVTVTIDGTAVASKLDGKAIDIDPGQHTFVFVASDGTRVEQSSVTVNEGQKAQAIAVTIPTAASQAAPKPATESPALGSTPPDSSAALAPESKSAAGPWKTVGWVLGGIGVVGLGVGAAFGVVAINDTNDAHCNARNQCDAGSLSSARSAALGADIGLVAGGVLVAGGAALILFGPSREPKAGAIQSGALAPLVGPGGGGLVFRGAW